MYNIPCFDLLRLIFKTRVTKFNFTFTVYICIKWTHLSTFVKNTLSTTPTAPTVVAHVDKATQKTSSWRRSLNIYNLDEIIPMITDTESSYKLTVNDFVIDTVTGDSAAVNLLQSGSFNCRRNTISWYDPCHSLHEIPLLMKTWVTSHEICTGFWWALLHYNDVIMSAMAFQNTSLTVVYSTVYPGANQIKHQSFASLAFVRGIHRWPVNSPHEEPVTRKMSPFFDVTMEVWFPISSRWIHVIYTLPISFNIARLAHGS